MASVKNILIFPCGSEVALEIFQSLEHSIHHKLFGASSVDDHGKFVFSNYIGGLPFINDESFIPALKKTVKQHQIDAIYPAMDIALTILKQNEEELGCRVISSEVSTTEICLSKLKTYALLQNIIPTPIVYEDVNSIDKYPVFLKPNIGYGSRGVKKVNSKAEVQEHVKQFRDTLILEYLPGKEYTIDCFTNSKGELLFTGPRERKRIANGISVNTSTMPLEEKFETLAKAINKHVRFNGAWFFQLKERAGGQLVLMEIASRMAGSSAVYRAKGINFALLSVFNAFDVPVSVTLNDYQVELDRALGNKYRIEITYNHVYIDFDDTVVIDGKINTEMISGVYYFINQGKKVYLLTKHALNIHETLKKYRLQNLFDEVIHLKKEDEKWKFIKHKDSIYIDDSFAERRQMHERLGVCVFSPDMVSSLIQC